MKVSSAAADLHRKSQQTHAVKPERRISSRMLSAPQTKMFNSELFLLFGRIISMQEEISFPQEL